jgi:hypothetical protein
VARVKTKITFDYLGKNKDVVKLSVPSTRLDLIWEAVENELAINGFVRHNLAYHWLVNGTNVCFAKVLSTGGIIAQFRVDTGLMGEFEEYK